jgi:hypothetical protein
MLGALLTPARPFAVPSGEVFRAQTWGLGGRPVGKFTVLASIVLGPATSADDVAPPIRASCVRCSGDFLPPSPPAEKTTARQYQAGKASAGNWSGNGGWIDGHRQAVDEQRTHWATTVEEIE